MYPKLDSLHTFALITILYKITICLFAPSFILWKLNLNDSDSISISSSYIHALDLFLHLSLHADKIMVSLIWRNCILHMNNYVRSSLCICIAKLVLHSGSAEIVSVRLRLAPNGNQGFLKGKLVFESAKTDSVFGGLSLFL